MRPAFILSLLIFSFTARAQQKTPQFKRERSTVIAFLVNPADSTYSLECPPGFAFLRIYTLTGIKKVEILVNGPIQPLSVRTLPPGIYLAETAGGFTTRTLFVKEY